jgi:hypothetical protein
MVAFSVACFRASQAQKASDLREMVARPSSQLVTVICHSWSQQRFIVFRRVRWFHHGATIQRAFDFFRDIAALSGDVHRGVL